MQQLRVKLAFVMTAAIAGSVGAQAQNCPASKGEPLPYKYAGGSTVSAITPCDLMNRLYKFADDSMMGRLVGTPYHLMGAAYIEGELKKMGLKPGGTNGSYYQDFPIYSRVFDMASTISVGGSSVKAGSEFLVLPNGRAPSFPSTSVIYGGLISDTLSSLDSAAVAGKVLLVRPAPVGMSTADRAAMIQSTSYKAFLRASAGAAARIQIQGDSFSTALIKNFTAPQKVMDSPTTGPTGLILFTNGAAEKIFGGPLAGLTKGQAVNGVNFDVRFAATPGSPGRNVVAILPGSDPKLKGQYIAIGAHSDHVGFAGSGQCGRTMASDSQHVWNSFGRPAGAEGGRNLSQKPITPEEWSTMNARIADLRKSIPERADSICNGADDDGSGSVSVLEIAEAFAKGSVKPKRSLIFVWHAGEESGMWGSGYFMDNPTIPRDSLVAQLNIDMVGRGAATDVTGQAKAPAGSNVGAELFGGPNYLQLVGSRRLSTELGDLVEKVNTDKKHGFIFDYNIDADGHQQNIYCRSDHWSYGKWGVPVVFFTTGGHADYHQPTDEPQYILYDHMARVDNLIFDIAIAAANLDHRVVVDHAKPNPAPAASCKQ